MTLILSSLTYGLVAAVIFRHFTDAAGLRTTINRILAHVLEFRLFIDEPKLILRAQRELVRENARMLGQIALPCLMMAVLFVPFYEPLDNRLAYRPLRAGETTVVTAPLFSQLTPPPGIVIETPGVRVMRTRQISWRVRAVSVPYGEFAKGFDVQYERANILGLPWLAWFLMISTLTTISCVPMHARLRRFRHS